MEAGGDGRAASSRRLRLAVTRVVAVLLIKHRRDFSRSSQYDMPECWLKTNHRILWVEFVLPVLLFALALTLVGVGVRGRHPALSALAAIPGAIGLLVALRIANGLRLPRLGYEDGWLLVYLRGSHPIRVPVDVVEVFFRGQASALMNRGGQSETSTIVVRLAESASQWHQRDVDRMLGEWCDGYIIIRGTWCQPIDARLLETLNRRLVEVHRQRRQEQTRGS